MKLKKILGLGLAVCLALSLAACGAKEEPVTMRVAAMTGPTGMGLVKLMKDSETQ